MLTNCKRQVVKQMLKLNANVHVVSTTRKAWLEQANTLTILNPSVTGANPQKAILDCAAPKQT